MDGTLTWSAGGALFAALALLALVPSLSVATVASRSIAHGFAHGAMTTLGIVVADAVLIVVAVIGLAAVMSALGDLAVAVRYAGGAYLLWLGVSLLRAPPAVTHAPRGEGEGWLASFMAGFLLTLGDQKALVFYLGFFPAFIDLGTIGLAGTLTVVALAVVAVGGVKLGYAFAADRLRTLMPPRVVTTLNRLAGGMMILVGAVLILGA